MEKRLRIAKKLLSDRGVIFISIDDNEQANLKLLCDEAFMATNCIGCLPTIMNLKGNQAQFGFAGTHEYTLVYVKSISDCELGNLPVSDEDLDSWQEDEIGYFKRGATLKRTGADAPRDKRPYGYFPILVDDADLTVHSITEEEYGHIYNSKTKTFDDDYVDYLNVRYTKLGYYVILPVVDGKKASWRWGFKKVQNNLKEIILTGSDDISLYKKQRPELGNIPSKKPKSVLYKAQYSSGNGTAQLKEVGLAERFNNPKPIDLIIDFLRIGSKNDSTILDFFAGSGTTLHAVMQLNAEDGGHRQCILCTNNENGICENVTYERNKRVIQGYTKPNGEKVEGLHDNNLRYYRTEFIGRSRTPRNMQRLVELSTDMLCIKEDLYAEQTEFGGMRVVPRVFRYFAEGERKMLIIYREEYIEEIVGLIAKVETTAPIRVYVFSPSEDPASELFEPVAEKVEPVALPAAIYNTYKRILPKRRDRRVDTGADAEGGTDTETDDELGGLFETQDEA